MILKKIYKGKVNVKVRNQKQNNNGVYKGVKSTSEVALEDYIKISKNENMLVLGKAGAGMSRRLDTMGKYPNAIVIDPKSEGDYK